MFLGRSMRATYANSQIGMLIGVVTFSPNVGYAAKGSPRKRAFKKTNRENMYRSLKRLEYTLLLRYFAAVHLLHMREVPSFL